MADCTEEIASGTRSDYCEANPAEMWLEPTSRCNTRCRHCQHYYRDYGQDIDAEVWEKVRADVMPSVRTVILNGYGEPFLARIFPAMLSECGERGLHIFTTSNGILLRDRERVADLVRRPMTLILSVDGGNKEAYESVRPLIKWERMIETLDLIHQERKAAGAESRICLKINFVGMKRNIASLPDLIRLAHKYNVGEITQLPLGDEDNLPELRGESLLGSPEILSPIFMEAIPLARRLGVVFPMPLIFWELTLLGAERRKGFMGEAMYWIRRIRLDGLLGGNSGVGVALRKAVKRLQKPVKEDDCLQARTCPFPWTSTNVIAEGIVYPCCVMSEQMGNLKTQSWGEIWNGRLYRSLRRTAHSWNPPKGCRFCALPTGINGGDERRYDGFFSRFEKQPIAIDSPDLQFGGGFYDLEYYEGKPYHRWMGREGRFSLAMRPGAKFIRLTMSRLTPGGYVNTGACVVNGGKAEPFDTTCDVLTFPVDHVKSSRIDVSIAVEEVFKFGDDPRDLGLAIRSIEFLS